MSRAQIDTVEPDAGRARAFLAQAQVFVADAEQPGTSLEGAVVLYYQACLSAMDGLLAAVGRRVGAGVESHSVRIAEAARHLGGGYAELTERLQIWRSERAEVSYAAITPGAQDVAALREDAHDLLAAVHQFLDTN